MAFDPKYESAGKYAVGHTTISVTDSARARTLSVEIWYPADETARAAAQTGAGVETFVVDADDRSAYTDLLAAAPAGCPSTRTNAARDAAVAPGSKWPLLVFSHCHNCVRFSSFAIAERLASWGFIVAAPDHADNTLFDDLAGTGVELSEEFLRIRAGDIRFVLDVMLDPSSASVPDQLRGLADADRVGAYGHSFGAVTTGMVIQDDPRPKAGFAIATPMENPLLAGVLMENISVPVAFLLAVEDNSISEFGNLFIRRNFDNAVTSAWKGEVADAGHWSFSDICAVDPQFAACCGSGERQTDQTPFEYLPVNTGIAVAQAYVTAFFLGNVMGDATALRYLEEPRPDGTISVALRAP